MKSLTWRWFWRSTIRGEYLWLWLAVILASASVAFMSQLSQSVRATMIAETVSNMGAQLILRSTHPIPAHWAEQARAAQIQVGELIQFNTMIAQGDDFQLVSLRAISPEHPDHRWFSFPDKSQPQVVVDQPLASKLKLTLGQPLTLGQQAFELVSINTYQDPLTLIASQIAPPVFIPIGWVERLGLMSAGSRISHELTFLGETEAVEQFYRDLKTHSSPSWQLIRADQRDTDLETTLATAWLFLDITSLTSLLIAGLAILLASRFYLQRWLQTLALLRALGVQQRQLFWVFSGQLLLLSVFASLLGMILGLVLLSALSPLLANWLGNFTLAPPWQAIYESLLSAILMFWVFTLPIFWQMMQTRPQQLFRQVTQLRRHYVLAWSVSGVLLLAVMALLLPAGLRLPVMLGVALVAGLLWMTAWLLQWGLFRLQAVSSGWLRLVIANLKYDRLSLMLQFVAFGLVLYLLLVLTLVHLKLVNHWQASLNQTSPNVFVINIQPEEQQQVANALKVQGIEVEMIPMLRARLIAHNGLSLSVEQFSSPRAKRLLDREANMAIMTDLPEHNQVVAKIAPADRDLTHPAISVERGIAELFALNLADRLVFDMQGQQMSFQITAIREVVWQSLQPNFFFIAQPWTEEQLPVTYLTSFHSMLAAEEAQKMKAALQELSPSLLWIDVRSLIAQLQQLMQQAGTAVSFLYGFALIASLLVVLSATLAAQEGRYQQWLVLRTLGANRRQLLVIGLSEYALIGLLAGTLASILAQMTQALIAVYWLDLPPAWDIELWLLGWGMGVFTLLLVAYLAQSPLRNASGVHRRV